MNLHLAVIDPWVGYFLEPKAQREARVVLVTSNSMGGPFMTVFCFRGKKGRVFHTFGRN